MAHLRQDHRTGNWCVGFRFGGREYLRSCRTSRKPVALRIEATVEETIELLDTGRLVLPDGVEPGHCFGSRDPKRSALFPGEVCIWDIKTERLKARLKRDEICKKNWWSLHAAGFVASASNAAMAISSSTDV